MALIWTVGQWKQGEFKPGRFIPLRADWKLLLDLNTSGQFLFFSRPVHGGLNKNKKINKKRERELFSFGWAAINFCSWSVQKNWLKLQRHLGPITFKQWNICTVLNSKMYLSCTSACRYPPSKQPEQQSNLNTVMHFILTIQERSSVSSLLVQVAALRRSNDFPKSLG